MRLETSFRPDALNASVAEPHSLRHRSRTPMGRAGWLLGRCFLDHGKLRLRAQWGLSRRASLVPLKALDTFIHVALLPTPHARLRLARVPHDRHCAKSIRCRKHDIGPPHDLAWCVAIRNNLIETSPVRRAQVNAKIIPHRRRLTDLRTPGNLLLATEH